MTDIQNKKEYWFRRYPRLTISFILLVLFTISLFLVEFILGFKLGDDWFKDVTTNERSINLVEYSPNIDTYVFPTDDYCKYVDSKNLVQQKYKFRTDANGYIMPSKTYSQPDATIAFLGGSTTECLFVKEKNRFPNLSCKLIEKETGKKINSINLGVSGMNSMNGINVLTNKLLPEKPDYVVFMYNVNDLVTLHHTGTYWNTSNRALVKEKEEESFTKKIKQGIINTFPNIYSSLWNKFKKQNTDEWADYRNNPKRLDSLKICKSYKKSLMTFINVCKSWNINPVLMTQANRFLSEKRPKSNMFVQSGINYSDFVNTYRKMNNLIRETANENNIILVDLEQAIPKDTLHLYDVVHFNDNGSIKASQKIADILSYHLKED